MSTSEVAWAKDAISPIEDLLEDIRNGRMVILVDDEDRENEGDLVIPAQFATPDAINFMATHGRGLICLSLTQERVDQLGLAPVAANNKSRMQTAFLDSIEAAKGVSTGISAADRSRTIQTAIDASKGRDDIVSPGHVFPLAARNGGVLIRAGHTEASVDMSRLAGLSPAAVICEIMHDDGSMARLPDLVTFARRHNLKIGTIADLIAYRLRNDTVIKCTFRETFTSEYGGDWEIRVYHNLTDDTDHIALVKGEIDPSRPVMVRVHAINLLEDLFGLANGRSHLLGSAMKEIARNGSGAIVMPRDTDGAKVAHYLERDRQQSPPEEKLMRAYGLGCLMLRDIGARELILLTRFKPDNLSGLEGFGLRVAEVRSIPAMQSSDNAT